MIDYGMSNGDYHAHPALNASRIKLILKTPRDFKEGSNDIPSKSKILGTAVHTLILEPHEFEARHALETEDFGNKTFKANKARWNEFKERNSGKSIHTTEDSAILAEIKAQVAAHSPLRILLAYGSSEITAITEGSFPLKARADLLLPDMILDVKTTRLGMSDAEIFKVIQKLHYDLQAAHYLRVFNEELGGDIKDFAWLFVDTTKGNVSQRLRLLKAPRQLLAMGEEKYKQAMETIEWCRETGFWPGYSEEMTELELPRWVKEKYA